MSAVYGVWVVSGAEFDPAEFEADSWAAKNDEGTSHVVMRAEQSTLILSDGDAEGSNLVAMFFDYEDAVDWVELRTGQKDLAAIGVRFLVTVIR